MIHPFGHFRELCGCLIRIEDDKISFAHYKVLEYPRSDCTTNSATYLFTIAPERVVRTHAELLYRTISPKIAQNIALD
jgi:hypothetical protein